MEYEEGLNRAYDLLADGRDAEAEAAFEAIIAQVKGALDGGAEDAGRLYYWGMCLLALDEPEQALLKFERAVRIDPGHEDALWQVASVLMHELGRPEGAKAVLEAQILPRFQRPKYREALADAEAAIRLNRGRAPADVPDAGGDGDAGQGAPGPG